MNDFKAFNWLWARRVEKRRGPDDKGVVAIDLYATTNDLHLSLKKA